MFLNLSSTLKTYRDSAVIILLCNRSIGILAGPISLGLIVIKLDRIEQGIYFTMVSILGMQVFFELGFGLVAMQTVSHMTVDLRVTDGLLIAEDSVKSKLGSFFRDVLKRYVFVSTLFAITMAIAGTWFLSRRDDINGFNWKHAWFLATISYSLNFYCNIILSLLEGIGLLSQVALGRTIQNIVSLITLCCCLAFGLKLTSFGVMHLASFVCIASWIGIKHYKLLLDVLTYSGRGLSMSWIAEIWPFQWRIALSWVAGYIGSQAIVPIIFDKFGPEKAGQFGLTSSLMSAAASISLIWMTTKAPVFGRLIASRNFVELDDLYTSAYKVTRIVALNSVVIIILTIGWIQFILPKHGLRFLPIHLLCCLGMTTFINVKISAQAVYLRSFKAEPFLLVSIINGLTLLAATLIMSRSGTVDVVIVTNTLITMLVANAMATPLFNKIKSNNSI
jgi:hypothetical protein